MLLLNNNLTKYKLTAYKSNIELITKKKTTLKISNPQQLFAYFLIRKSQKNQGKTLKQNKSIIKST